LESVDAVSKSPADNDFDFIGTAAFTHHAGELRCVKESSDTWIYGDTNGDGKAELAIRLDDAMTLKASYFEL
jgi:hypothetical protein